VHLLPIPSLAILSVAITALTGFAPALHANQAPVNLGTAGSYTILAKTGISTTGVTSIVGDIGVSPIDSTGVTGFDPILHSSGTYATSSMLAGKIFASDFATPTPSLLTTAVSDMETAYTDAAGRTLPDATELAAGDISGLTLAPGLYKWGSGLSINSNVTLSGSPTDVWILQIAQNLTVGDNARVLLSGGAQARNIFWQVAGEATLGTTSHFEGTLLVQTAIHLRTGATINGHLLAQSAVTLDASTVIAPEPRPEIRVLAVSRTPQGLVTLTFAVTPNQPVTLQESVNLHQWTTVQTTTPSATPYVVDRTTPAGEAMRFYRAFHP